MKYIIVTGDSRGLGFDIAYKILDTTNFGVIGLSRKESSYIQELKDKFPEKYHHFNVDLSYPDQLKGVFFNQIKKIGIIQGLVNNAAYAYDDIVSNMNISELEKMFRINVLSAIELTKLSVRNMLLNNIKGSFVHISSVSAHTGYKGLSMYASTKGAMEAFSKGFSREWGAKGIRSNCVAPGFMETEMSASLTEDLKSKIYARTSMKKETSLSSVSNTVVYLLSDKSESITGEVIHVNNGTI